MGEIMIVTIIAIIVSVLVALCFYCFGYISKELVLYWIRKSKKADEQLELARKIIDNSDKF